MDPIPVDVPSCIIPDTIEVTINGTIIIFNPFIKRSPKNCAVCKTGIAEVGSPKGKTTRAIIAANVRDKRICQ
jgi:hypothetical protein